jgi:PAS domain S-box-containing protein
MNPPVDIPKIPDVPANGHEPGHEQTPFAVLSVALATVADPALRATAERALGQLQAGQPTSVPAQLEIEYERLFHLSPDMLGLLDPFGMIVHVNLAFEQTLGYSPHEVIGTSVDQLIHPEDQATADREFLTLKEGKSVIRSLIRLRRKDGAWRWISWSAPSLAADQDHVYLTGRDVTEHHLLLEQLRTSEERLSYALASTNDGIWDLDLQTNTVFASPRFAAILGYIPGEFSFSFEKAAQLIHPEDWPEVQRCWHEHLVGNRLNYDLEFRMQHQVGHWVWVLNRGQIVQNSLGQPVRVVGTITDIGQRKAAEEALRESEARLRQLAEHVQQVFWLADPSGLIYLSPAFDQVWGFPGEEALRNPERWVAAIHPDDRAQFLASIATMPPAGGIELDFRIYRSQGEQRWLRIRSFPVYDSAGRPYRVAGVAEDITEHREQAVIQQRLVECSQLTGAAFFDALVQMTAETLQVRCAMVCLILPPEAPTYLQSVAAWHDQGLVANFGYPLAGTPCLYALQHDLWYHPDKVAEHFPDDALLSQLALESYLARPLRADDGQIIGLLVVADSKPIKWEGHLRVTLEIFAGRAASELARVQAQARIQELNADLEHRVHERTLQLAAANAALQQADARQRALLDAIPDVLFRVHRDGTVLDYALPKGVALPPVDRYIGRTLHDSLLTPAMIKQTLALHERVLATGIIETLEYSVVESGRPCHLEARFAQSGPDELVVTIRDITDRVNAETALRASETRFRQFADSMPFVVWMIDVDTEKFIYVSPAYSHIFGDTVDALYAEPRLWFRWVHPDDQERVRNNVRLMDGTTTRSVEFRVVRRGGQVGMIHMLYVPIRNPQGQVLFHTGIAEDITERRMAEAQIRRLNEVLEAHVQQRTADLEVVVQELESFSYSVSHDLRAPLRTINGFSQMLLEDYGAVLGAEGSQALDRIRSASTRMATLIDDILDLSRVSRSELHRVPVNLSEMVQLIALDLQLNHPERRAEFVITPDLWARADPNLIEVLLNNLLGNAWKYTSKHAQARIVFGALPDQGGPIYFVQDDGAGFDMTYVDKLFVAFQRLHHAEEFDGSGVGLATVQRIVQRHGGRVWAEGAIEQGATFYFTLSP